MRKRMVLNILVLGALVFNAALRGQEEDNQAVIMINGQVIQVRGGIMQGNRLIGLQNDDQITMSVALPAQRGPDAELLPILDELPGVLMKQTVEGLTCLALAPQGALLAVGNKEGQIQLLDSATLEQLRVWQAHEGGCVDVCFTFDGTGVISAGADMKVRQFTTASGREERVFEGHQAPVQRVVCSPDGRLLASSDSAATIKIWDLRTGKALHDLTGHTGPKIESLAFSPDSRVLASEANDETARLWDPLHGAQLRVLPQHDNYRAVLAFSPDGAWGVSTRGGGVLRLWEASTGQMQRVLQAHQNYVTGATFSPCGTYLLTAGQDKTLRQWHVASGLELRRLRCSEVPAHIVYERDGRSALTANARQLIRWDLAAPPLGVRRAVPANLAEAAGMLASRDYNVRTEAATYYFTAVPAAEAAQNLVGHLTTGPEAYRAQILNLEHEQYSFRLAAFERLLEAGPGARPAVAAALEQASSELRGPGSQLLTALTQAEALAREILGLLDKRENP